MTSYIYFLLYPTFANRQLGLLAARNLRPFTWPRHGLWGGGEGLAFQVAATGEQPKQALLAKQRV